MNGALLEQVRTIVGDVLQVPVAAVGLHSSPENMEQWDSVQHLNIILAIEESFGLQFDPDEIDSMKTVEQIVLRLESRLPQSK